MLEFVVMTIAIASEWYEPWRTLLKIDDRGEQKFLTRRPPDHRHHAHRNSTPQRRILVLILRAFCSCSLHCHYLILPPLKPHSGSPRVQFPSVIRPFCRWTADSDFRKNGRAPRSSTKAVEYAFLNFDLEADLSSLFNWNTKQVFAYLVADYKTTKYVRRLERGPKIDN